MYNFLQCVSFFCVDFCFYLLLNNKTKVIKITQRNAYLEQLINFREKDDKLDMYLHQRIGGADLHPVMKSYTPIHFSSGSEKNPILPSRTPVIGTADEMFQRGMHPAIPALSKFPR